jgi:hypothetical protein
MGPCFARPEDRLRGRLEGRTIVLQQRYFQAAVSPSRCAVFHTRQ